MKYLVCLFFVACGPFMSPADAYRIESEQCLHKQDSEEIRKCQSWVDKKYSQYNNEGSYPR